MTLLQKIRGLQFSALELEDITRWTPAVIEDYLDMVDNINTIVDYIDRALAIPFKEVDVNATLITADGTILADASANTVTITLEAEPKDLTAHRIFCVDSTFLCAVDPNGKQLDGALVTVPLVSGDILHIRYDGTQWWRLQ